MIQYCRSAGVDNSDRFICAVSNIGFWDRGSDMILGRVLKLKIAGLNGADWEYFTGGDGMKPSAQVPHCNDAKPIIEGKRKWGMPHHRPAGTGRSRLRGVRDENYETPFSGNLRRGGCDRGECALLPARRGGRRSAGIRRRMSASCRCPPASGCLPRPARRTARTARSMPRAPTLTTWVQIDLGEKRTIDSVKVYPANDRFVPGQGFPLRFKIEVSSEPEFRQPTAIVSHLDADVPNPKGAIQKYPAAGVEGRYVRLTATRLPQIEPRRHMADENGYYLAIGKMDVYSGGKNIAELCPVTADAAYGNDDDLPQVTRPERAGGENTFMDHPENVTDPSTWKPPAHKVKVPRSGVTLNGGVFQTAMEKNIRYLLDSYSVDDLLRQFRERAGVIPPFAPPNRDVKFWEEDLAGSNAGRFLMAAGNTLRWMEHPELRRRLNAVVDGIAQYREPNGYIMAYPPNTILYSERGGYTRAWVTHGLIEAAYAGNPKAFDLLRGYYDWFNQNPYLTADAAFQLPGRPGHGGQFAPVLHARGQARGHPGAAALLPGELLDGAVGGTRGARRLAISLRRASLLPAHQPRRVHGHLPRHRRRTLSAHGRGRLGAVSPRIGRTPAVPFRLSSSSPRRPAPTCSTCRWENFAETPSGHS